jgi:hypothetical protein
MYSSEMIHDYTIHMSYQGRSVTLRDIDTTLLGVFVTKSTSISHTVWVAAAKDGGVVDVAVGAEGREDGVG